MFFGNFSQLKHFYRRRTLDNNETTRIISVNNINQSTDTNRNYPCFIVIAGANVGKMYKLETSEALLGRMETNHIVINDEGISRTHCRILQLPENQVMLEDLNSTNGTYINSERINRAVLKDGDKIQIGSTTILKFTYSDKLEENFQKQMYESALKDGLTKIYNKRFFLEQIETEFAYSVRHSDNLHLFMLDIDHFKKINDTYGHLCGDSILMELAARIQKAIRAEDIFARYGGEEFAIIARGISADQALLFGERIRLLIATQPFIWEDKALTVTISIGLASFPHSQITDSVKLIKAADEALYKSKNTGRNRVSFFEKFN